jgi:hypothetical protein
MHQIETNAAKIQLGGIDWPDQYSSASMIVITRSVTVGSDGLRTSAIISRVPVI